MLSVLELTNFQSHRSTRLELGAFTAIVGPSSSGKSALVRALSVLATNGRGTSYVRTGAKTAEVQALSVQSAGDPAEAGIAVAVRRGVGVSEYRLTIPDLPEEVFTKCGTTVPDTVSAAMDFGFDDMWLAGQFDRPFLLDETGSAVARTLGVLTNVTMIYSAVREVNRRSSSTSAKLKDRSEALAAAKKRVISFADLPAKRASLDRSEEALARMEELQARRDALAAATQAVRLSTDRLKVAVASLREVPSLSEVRALATRRARLQEMVRVIRRAVEAMSVPVVTPPSLENATALGARRAVLRTAMAAVQKAERQSMTATEAASLADEELSEAQEHLRVGLQSAGRCPLCGADTSNANVDRLQR